jgi:hypothetical protein
MRRREGLDPPLDAEKLWKCSAGARHRPAEAGELPSNRDGDDRGALAAVALEPRPRAMQSALGLCGDRERVGGLASLSSVQRRVATGPPAIVPCGLDQEPPGVLGETVRPSVCKGLGDGWWC